MTDRFAGRLLQWYDQHGRKNLPWHEDRTPYRVWISEIMLQQTQVATVIPFYQAFMARFPTVAALAEAPVDDVLSHWSGLGYYARARNLHKAAKTVMSNFGGQFPDTTDALEQLPGIGRSTAAAIIAQALNRRAAILDGNVKRVLARYHRIEGWPGQTRVQARLWLKAEEHTPEERPRDYTQAIMDLGALLCTRRNPDCKRCPVSESCEAYRHGDQHQFPASKPKAAKPEKSVWMLLLEDAEGRILLEQRPPAGIWGGLWSLPEMDPEHDAEDLPGLCQRRFSAACNLAGTLAPFRHTFSHYHLHVKPALLQTGLTKAGDLEVKESGTYRWLHRDQALNLGLPAPVRQLLTDPGQPELI